MFVAKQALTTVADSHHHFNITVISSDHFSAHKDSVLSQAVSRLVNTVMHSSVLRV